MQKTERTKNSFLVGLRSGDVFGISEPVGKEGKLGVQKAEKTICVY